MFAILGLSPVGLLLVVAVLGSIVVYQWWEHSRRRHEEGAASRPVLVTIWLLLVLTVNAVMTVVYVGASIRAGGNPLPVPPWFCMCMALSSSANVVSAMVLLKGRRWGFYLICANAGAGLILNLTAGVPLLNCPAGLLGIGILYGVLQLGKPRSVWSQLV
jgi:hypothetical protein